MQTTHHDSAQLFKQSRLLPRRLLSTEKVLSAAHPQSAGIAASRLLTHMGHHRQHAFAHVCHGVCACVYVLTYDMGARVHSS